MNKKHKLFSFFFLLAFSFQFFSLTLLSRVSAQTAPQRSPQQIAMAYSVGRALEWCTDRSGLYRARSANEIRGGNVFGGDRQGGLGAVLAPVNSAGRTTEIGYLVDTDGKLACNEGGEINAALRKIGYENARDFFETAGIYRYNGNNDTYELESSLRGDNPAVIAKIKAEITKKFGVRFGSDMPDAAQYATLKAAFEKGCEARRSSTGKPVVIVNSSGASETINYQFDDTSLVSVGFGISEDGGNDGRMECQTIVSVMGKKAPAYAQTATDNNPNNDPEQNSDLSADNNPTCESSGLTVAWIICPFVNGMAEATDFIFDNLIRPLLVARDIGYTDGESGIFQVWSGFRSMANIILILVLIVVVFGQAIGGGAIDAYTAKKVLPRIFAVAILINISIYLVVLALDVANIIGAGINSLIYSGFQGAGEFELEIGTGAAAGGTVGIGAAAAITAMFAKAAVATAATGGGLIASVLPWIGLFIVLPAVLIGLAIFVTLIIRQGIIILLVIIAPVALAAYVLPNTEKFFKQWWSLLFKTLMVYPIVMIIFAIADVMAVVVSGTLPLALDWLGDLIAIALLIIPLLLIPFAFKLAGGAIGSLYGTLSGFGKKTTELAKGDARDPLSMRNRAKSRARSGLNDSNLSGSAVATRMNPFMRGDRRQARLGSIRDTNQALYGTDTAQAALVKSASQDDKVMTDLAMFGSSKASREAIDAWTLQKMDDAKQARQDQNNPISEAEYQSRLRDIDATRKQKLVASETADRIGRTTANRRMAVMQPSFIGYGLDSGEQGWNTAVSAMKDISGGDESQLRSMVNEFQFVAKGAGRADLSGNTDSDEYNGDRAWKSVGLYQQSNGKPKSIEGSGQHYLDKFNTAASSLTDTPDDIKRKMSERDDVAVFYKELEAMLPNSTGGVRDEIVKQMQALDAAGIQNHLNQSMGTTRVAVRDENDPNNYVWEERDVTRGQLLSAGKIEGKRVRAYEKPDPNRLNEES